MLPGRQRKASIGVGVGVLLQCLGIGLIFVAAMTHSQSAASISLITLLAGSAVFAWGCAVWAEAKGHSGLMGFLLAMMGWVGLLVLFALPDKDQVTPADREKKAA